MHVEFLVEDASSEAAIEVLLERLLSAAPDGHEHSWRIHPFNGKQRMLTRLPSVLSGILQAEFANAVVVLIDADQDDCVEFKRRLQEIVASCMDHRHRQMVETQVWVRIAVTELEAWFIGDSEATRAAYAGVTAGDLRLTQWREADSVPDAWEWLERLPIRRGHYVTRMPKTEVARNVARQLDLEPERNRSSSFRLFLRTLREIYEL